MADFNDFSKKASNFAASAAGKARDLAAYAADKAKRVGRIAKLNLDISSEKESIRRAYTDIGKLYYEMHKDAPEGFFVQLCEEISASEIVISQKETEINTLKESFKDSDCSDFEDTDFETVVSETETEADVSPDDADVSPKGPEEDKPEE
jgi:hypothetical protein